ncbi:uncharacterized protein LOC129757285 [Uranotaenia lowii]|uniref:uncharacterized protein LOC129757285 n=1 Tax=Uranotaenia lowii TaxID=190385 RepID=UPI00247B0504|nr:uncharacterized protein LOC129757285 [Uranotaenia lowii]
MVFNCTLCGMGPRATIILVGIVSLIFSILYILGTTAGILAHNCVIPMNNSKEEYAIYLYYLRSSECGPVNLTNLGVTVPENFPIVLPDVSDAAFRTYIFCLVGVALYGVWAISTILMFGSACVSCVGRGCIVFGIYPFIIILFLVLAYEVVAFVIYLIDFIHSFDIDFVLDLLEVGNQEQVRPIFEQIDNIYLVVPPLIMWITAIKGFIFWLIFLLLAFVMMGVASRLWEENKPAPAYNSVVHASRTAPTAPVEQMEEIRNSPDVVAVSAAASRYKDPARTPTDIPSYSEASAPAADENVVRTVEPLKGGNDSPYLEQPPEQDRYDVNEPPPVRPKPILNPYTDKRFSYMPGNPQPFSYLAGPPQQVSPRNSTNVPTEVRSQLPWSYFRNSEELGPPKRVTSTLNDQSDFPGADVAVPMTKPGAPDDRSSDEGKWSGPEYRY